MKWFEGDIGAAVQSSKSKHVILMVYIEGQDELSKKMESTWSDSAVAGKCESAGFISIKLKANSEMTAQFCQIYPVVCVPCTYFIGENGIPLEVTGGHVEPQQFAEKIASVIQMHLAQLVSQKDTAVQKETSTQEHPVEATPGPSVVEKEAVEVPEADAAEASKPSEPLEKRVEKVQEMINKKREQRQREEQEKELKKEKERIQLGREMAKLKNYKEQKEAEELREQMKKDRLEEKLARQRIKEQIAKDRADRAARYEMEKKEKEEAKQQRQQAKEANEREELARLEAIKRETASIQFRLPDGKRITNRFQSSDTLGDARAYLLERVGSSMPSVKLCGTYPKRDFTESDMSQTLLDLNLAPSAALIVLPGGSRSAAPRSGDGGESGGFIWMLLAPFIAIWNFIYNFLFAAPPRIQERPEVSSATATHSGSQPTSSQTSTGTRPKSSYGVRSRREGNMYRLSADDEDDESATWNGNSTQQM